MTMPTVYLARTYERTFEVEVKMVIFLCSLFLLLFSIFTSKERNKMPMGSQDGGPTAVLNWTTITAI